MIEAFASDTRLSVRDLRVEFASNAGHVAVVDGVSFDLARAEVLAIVGESGCGKTMTALAILGLLPQPNGRIGGGEILFGGEDLVAMGEPGLCSIRGRRIAMVFQEPMSSLNPVRTVASQIAEPLRVHLGMSRKQARGRALELLDRVGIASPAARMDAYPHEFSGGQRQRIMIAIAIACDPDILIADEPTTALDVTIQAQVLDLLRDIQAQSGLSVLFITHDLGIVAEFADRVAVMYAGKIVESGPVATFFESPAHPYTEALLACLPDPERPAARLRAIDGRVPRAFEMPRGCRFAPRCGFRRPLCGHSEPALFALSEARRAACFKPFDFQAPTASCDG